MLKLLHLALELAYTTLVYYVAFLCYYVGQQPIGSCSILAGQDQPLDARHPGGTDDTCNVKALTSTSTVVGDTKAEVHLYSLAKQLLLWDTPHYR